MPPPPTPKRAQPAQNSQSQSHDSQPRLESESRSHYRSGVVEHTQPLGRDRDGDGDREGDGEKVDTGSVNDARSRKRKARELGTGRDKGRASRRRSTLSPWELESLILGGAGVASPEK